MQFPGRPRKRRKTHWTIDNRDPLSVNSGKAYRQSTHSQTWWCTQHSPQPWNNPETHVSTQREHSKHTGRCCQKTPPTHKIATSKTAAYNTECKYCAGKHSIQTRDHCPAFGTTCNLCGKPNHWAKACMGGQGARSSHQGSNTRKKSQFKKKNRQVHALSAEQHESESEEDTVEHFAFDSIQVCSLEGPSQNEAFANITRKPAPADGKRKIVDLKCKIDTGAQANIIPLRIFQKIYPEELDSNGLPMDGVLRQSDARLFSYGGTEIKQYGTRDIQCHYKGNQTLVRFYIADANARAILGLPTTCQLGLVQLNCAITSTTASTAGAETHQVKNVKKSPMRVKFKTPNINSPVRDKESLRTDYPTCFEGTTGEFDREFQSKGCILWLRDGCHILPQFESD